MNTKAKLLSLCLAAVLLCGCVVGFMMVGANALPYDDSTVKWTVVGVGNVTDSATQFETLQAAMKAAETYESWAADDVLSIVMPSSLDCHGTSLKDNIQLIKVEDGVLFGVKTIWRGEGDTRTKLPINICGTFSSSTGYGTANANRAQIGLTTDGTTRNTDASLRAACSNDYRFVGLESVGLAGEIYAGCGNITIFNSRFSSLNVSFSADNFTEAVYRGWTATDLANAKDSNGKVATSLLLDSDGATSNAARLTLANCSVVAIHLLKR